MTGSLGYIYYRRYRDQLWNFGRHNLWLIWALWAVVLVYGRLPGTMDERACIFIPLVALAIPLLFTLYKDDRRDRAIGELSYPLYLIHPLVLFVLHPLSRSHFYPIGTVLVALGLSWLFYHFIEFKLDRYRARLFRRSHQVAKVKDKPKRAE